MNGLAILMSVALIAVSAIVTAQDKTTGTIKSCVVEISDMACSSCAKTIQKALVKIDGVKSAEVSQPTGLASITYDESKTDPQALAKAITKKTGFPAKPRAEK